LVPVYCLFYRTAPNDSEPGPRNIGDLQRGIDALQLQVKRFLFESIASNEDNVTGGLPSPP
jgi:hypothetical protein